MPFGRSPKLYEPIKNLASVASEAYQDLRNCFFRHNPESDNNQETEVIKTKGWAQYGTNASNPPAKRGLGIGAFTPSVGSYGAVYAAWDRSAGDYTEIWKLSSSADPVSVGVYSFLPTQDTDVEFEQAFDNQYVTNGIDPVLKQTGSTGVWTQAAAATAPYGPAGTVAKYLAFHNYMMFAGRTVNAPNILYVSDAGAPDTFTGPVTKTFRHEIVGLKPLSDYLMVYTKKEVHAVSGFVPSQLSYRQLAQGQPCVSHRSIVTVIGGAREYSATGVQSNVAEHWYMGEEYVWATNGSTFRILGKESWEMYRPNLNTSLKRLASAVFDHETGQYLLSVTTGSNTENNVTWAYDPQADKWIEKPFLTASAWAKYGHPSSSIYFTDSRATGKAYQLNSGNTINTFATQLNGAIDSTSTASKVVDSTTGWPTSGVAMVENEAIYYSGIDATHFGTDSIIRGFQGTTKASHADNSVVTLANEFRYRTRNLYLGNTNMVKKFQVLWGNYIPSTIAYSLSVNIDVDQQGFSLAKNIPLATSGMTWGTDVWGTSTWGSPAVILTPENRAPLSGRGKGIKISLEEKTSIKQTEVTELELRYRPVKIK